MKTVDRLVIAEALLHEAQDKVSKIAYALNQCLGPLKEKKYTGDVQRSLWDACRFIESAAMLVLKGPGTEQLNMPEDAKIVGFTTELSEKLTIQAHGAKQEGYKGKLVQERPWVD
jgi:hypothetical protein